MFSKKLQFALKKVKGKYMPVAVKCPVLNLRQVGEVVDLFLDEISKTLLKEQKQLIKQVNDSKLPARQKLKYIKVLKSGLISNDDMEFIKDKIA